MTQHRQFNKPPPPQTIRIWARDEAAAEQMVSEGSDRYPVELDGDAYAVDIGGHDVLPYLVSGRAIVRCLNCTRLFYAAAYIDSANHACIPAGQFVGDELDGQASA
jgi:hypothetical protein